MKRVITGILVLVFCFSLAVPVYAAAEFVSDITTKPALKLVAVDEENVGVFYDSEGNEISRLKKDSILITALSEVETTGEISEDEKASLREAYEKPSDTYAFLSVQAPAMNEVAVELLGEGSTADDFVIHDLFLVTLLNEEDANILSQEGNVLKLTFAMEDGAEKIIAAMTHVDNEWVNVEIEHNEDNTITCTIDTIRPIAFLIPTGAGSGEGSEIDDGGVVQPPEQISDNFVPSISAKPAPELVPDADGYYGGIIDADGHVTDELTGACIVAVAVTEFDITGLIPEDAAEELRMVYERLSHPDTKLSEEAPAMNAVAEALLGKGHTADDFVIRDLFDLRFACEEHQGSLTQKDVSVNLTFDLGIDPDTVITAMVYIDDEWIPVETVNNGDDTVTCRFEDFCPVAFLVANEKSGDILTVGDNGGDDEIANPDTPDNAGSESVPVESDSSNAAAWTVSGIAGLIAIFAAVFFFNRGKKKVNV